MKAVNLIPSEQRSGGSVGSRSNGAAFAVLGLLGGFAVLTFLYGSSRHELESREAEATTLSARAQQVQTQAAQLTPYTSFMSMHEQRLQSISQLINSRFDWAAAMGELSRVLPGDVALSSLQGTVGAQTGAVAGSKSAAAASSASVSSATPAGATPTFTLAGCAASQTVVAQVLVRLRLISGVSNVTLQSSAKSNSGAGASGGACPAGDPVFSVNVTFQALPTPPAMSTAALESTASTSSTASTGSTAPTSSTGSSKASTGSSSSSGAHHSTASSASAGASQ